MIVLKHFQHLRRLTGDTSYLYHLVERKLREVHLPANGQPALAIGYRIAMGIGLGKTKKGIQPVDELAIAHMLQLFGYLMHLIPAKL